MTGDVVVTADGQSLGNSVYATGSYYGYASGVANAYGNLTGDSGVSVGGDVTVDAVAVSSSNEVITSYYSAEAYASANAAGVFSANDGSIDLSGDVTVNADAQSINNSITVVGSESAVGYGYADADLSIDGEDGVLIGGDLEVGATARTSNNMFSAAESYASASASADVVSESGTIDITGVFSVEADAQSYSNEVYASNDADAGASADAAGYLTGQKGVSVGGVEVIANAISSNNIATASSNGTATAGAYASAEFYGSASDGAVTVAGDVELSAVAQSTGNYGAAYGSYAYVNANANAYGMLTGANGVTGIRWSRC
ncbi:hypothetical protein [Candidatus Reidiella endopervernicosa]|uniref:Uncharacterized protein n=1 Tax=Candidatus Reidiella endopervernicosa TaxID=2738883 RepID=A0A6N0HV45_9GAMM|nr:hypothetical protein [Candidatus Reidiella endopervernicosa]QKQ26061.1 hypothetical protein HUE57_07020 [Candidatus Reidiella endopervernicosa]